jgi:hypothetical protein
MFGEIGLIAMGRRACEQMARAWSSSDSPMARVINALPKVIYSQTLDEVDWSNTRISRAAIDRRDPELKAEAARTSSSSAAATSATA